MSAQLDEQDLDVIRRCPPCERGPGMWMATFADMAILLMAMFVLLIALAETAKQRNTMFSIPGENQSAFGTQDIIESDLKPSGYQGANVSADTNEGYDQVVKALAKEINDGKVEVTIKDQRVVVNVEGSDNPNSDTARVQQEELEIYTKVAEVQRKIKVDVKVFQESEGTTSDSEAWEEMFSAQYRQIRGDLAQAIELCIKKDGLGYEVFNVTHDNNSVNLTAREIINKFFPNVKMKREMGEYESILSSKKIRESLGFKPIHDWKNYFKV